MKQIYFLQLLLTNLIFGLQITNAQVEFTESPGNIFEPLRNSSIGTSDIDGDGDNDFLIIGRNSDFDPVTHLYINEGSGNFVLDTNNSFPDLRSGSVNFADVNGDDVDDLFITGTDQNLNKFSTLYINDGEGLFSQSPSFFRPVSNSSVVFEDIDNDTDLDVIFTGETSPEGLRFVSIYTNDGSGNFRIDNRSNIEGFAGDDGLVSLDLENDGDQDIIITGKINSINTFLTKMYINNGVGVFTEASETSFAEETFQSLAVGDINNDNFDDLIITSRSSVSTYLNDTEGGFNSVSSPFNSIRGGKAVITDIDDDGDNDVMMTGFSSILYINDGEGNFSSNSGFSFPGFSSPTVAIVDVDANNSKDVIINGVIGINATSKLYKNLNDLDVDVPSIASIDNQSSCVNEDVIVQVQISDNVSISDNLTVSASSSNTSLVVDDNISISNTANEFTFTVDPEMDAIGITTIAINVTDETGNTAIETFEIIVSPNPELSVEQTAYTFNVNDAIAPITIQNSLIEDESFATYSNTNSGALNGTNFTVSSLNQAIVSNLNLNNPNWNSVGFRPGIEYNATSPELTITFESPVENLNFYLYFLRGTASGYETYTFSEPFVVTHGLNGLPTTSTTIDASNFNFASGIIQFENPITTLTVTGSGQGGQFGIGGGQGFTISQSPELVTYTASSTLPEGLSLDENTGVISGTPLSSTPATDYTVTGTMESNCSGSVTLNIATNSKPTISDVEDLSIEANTSVTFQVELQDEESSADDLILTASSGDTDLINTFDISNTGSTRSITITPETDAIGSTNITFSVEDQGGAITETEFTVNVIDIPTVFTQDIEVALDASGEVSITPEDIDDGSSSISGIESLELDITSFSCDDIGNNTVTLTVTSNSGETATGTAIVTVIDNLSPAVVTQNITVELDANGEASVTAAQIDNGSADNCGVDSLVLDVTTFDCSDLGENTVTLTVTDASGNEASATAIVTVEDNTDPIAIATDFSITTYDWNDGPYAFLPDYVNDGSSDNCGIDVIDLARDENSDGIADSGYADRINLTCADVGTTFDYLFRVTDNSGNSTVITRTLTIEDNINPTVLTQNITVQLDATGEASITPVMIDNGSSDDCSVDNLALDVTTFDCSDLGENTVTLTVTDASGNEASATAIVTVVDNIAPTLVLQDVTVELSAEGTVSVDASAFDNGSFDNCGEVTFSTNLVETLSCGSLGLIEVTVTATDASGNKSQNTAILTVEDNIAPSVVTQAFTVELDASGSGTITTADVDNGSADNCSIDNLALDVTSFDCSNLGENTVTLTVTDASGNQASATAIVTVVDNVLPTVVTQAFTVELDASGSATITTADVDNGSADNCSIDNLALDVTTFDCSNLGENTVTLTATDASGNEASTTAIVTVVDVSGPVLVTQDITVNLDENGSVSILPGDVLSSVEDNCTISQNITLSLDQDTFTAIGVYEVSLTSKDASGNSTSTTAEVTVDDTLSIDDNDLNVEIKLYPNPASDNIYFEISNAKIQSISIYDINGRLIKTSDNISINISELSSGIYFAKVEGERMKTFKVLRFIKK